MRTDLEVPHVVFAPVLLALLMPAAGAFAQSAEEPLTPAQIAIACAIPPVLEVPRTGGGLRIIGGQTPEPRELFSARDLLFVNGGSGAGLQLGQQFFIRRPVTFGDPTSGPRAVHTSGWIRIVAINDTTAVASVDHQCSDIALGDYLDPFVAPSVPDGADRVDASGDPDFDVPGRILFGRDETSTGAAGDVMLIDRGTDQGVAAGSRLAIFRALAGSDVPMVSIGEAIVLETAQSTSAIRITLARDSISGGDLVFPRKP